jgi:CTP synthase
VGVQCHPEFKSKPTKAQPLFAAFVKAAIKRQATVAAAKPEKPARKAKK